MNILLLVVIFGFNSYFFVSWMIVFVREMRTQLKKRKQKKMEEKKKKKAITQNIDMGLLSANSVHADVNSTKKELKQGMSDMLEAKHPDLSMMISISPSNDTSVLSSPKFFRGAKPDPKRVSVFDKALRDKGELTDDLSKEQL